ncbi:MAG: hypothetical protein VR68_15625 [Peptococcaceae bacterium BRH_c4a]|nr:MAG: hypothetical protein VR68_15625 [Peptococcaceae bacterium BRH_c4a]
MPKFSYRALDSRGQVVAGSLSGDSMLAVRQSMKNDGLVALEIREGAGGALSGVLSSFKPKREVNGEALSHFCRQLSVIMMSGVNILKGLEIMSQQTPDKLMRSEVGRIFREVQTGKNISEAMRSPGSLIPEMLSGMVATGEASGSLEDVLRTMSEFYDKEHRIKQKIKSASVYPIVMAVMAVGIIILFFNFLLPQILGMITATGGKLPLITRIVIAISEVFTRYYLIILISVVTLGVVLNRYFKTPGGRLNRDKFMLKVPMAGGLIRNVSTMRFARTAYILIHSGVPLLQGLELIKKNLNNAVAEKAMDYAIDGLQRGESMAQNLVKADYFDTMAIQMFSIGEETGELEKILNEMAEFYNQESDAGFAKFLAMVEPIMLVVIGGMVSVIIISVLLPMMDMFSNIKR